MNTQISIPEFCGFYNTCLDLSELLEIDDESGNFGNISQSDYDNINWQKTNENIAKDYFQEYKDKNGQFLKDCGITLLSFNSLESPREYNFRTDEIIANVKVNISKMVSALNLLLLDSENKAVFSEILEDRHKSRSGFSSFYAYDIETWLTEYLQKDNLDNVHIETLIIFFLWVGVNSGKIDIDDTENFDQYYTEQFVNNSDYWDMIEYNQNILI